MHGYILVAHMNEHTLLNNVMLRIFFEPRVFLLNVGIFHRAEAHDCSRDEILDYQLEPVGYPCS